ncbi:probable G-protein coupled receptor 139 [Carcharodon carcharias]|uniref:probable G-protein coupled receptor 139 n=1 Tax=Carcharodon carcharias TaxID=13397 RepID=UPI001B7F06FE|nr:probable G-protein coupled receptor 139 [Carcharodon carcharias]
MILSLRNCGLSKCVTRYLVGMSAADLLVVIFDVTLRQIPIVYRETFALIQYSVPVCNIHAVLLYAATDCSVWFTVTFTFDRFVAICCQKLKSKFCTARTAAVVLGSVSVLSCSKNIFWYFMLGTRYWLFNKPWFCSVTIYVQFSLAWSSIVFMHNILTPCVPFVLILLLNIFTVRHILVTSRARRRLRAHSSGDCPQDKEMENRRKSIILLFSISANFILLWSVFMFFSIWWRMFHVGYRAIFLDAFVMELGFMLQLLSCCTNTCIYGVTQSKFRDELKNALKYPVFLIFRFIKR